MTFNIHNKKVRAVAIQTFLSIVIIMLISYFGNNVVDNLERLGISSGFDFLQYRTGYDLYSPILPYSSDSTHFMAFSVGLLNTIIITFFGISLATVLGFIMGVLRLSDNWIVAKTMYVIIEFVRNVPVLIWIVIWYFGVFLQLPSPRTAINIMDSVFVSNRGLYLPAPIFTTGAFAIGIAFIISIFLKVIYNRRVKAEEIKTGKEGSTWRVSIALIIGLPLAVYFLAGQPIDWSIPELKGFNFKGGMALKPEFLSLLMGLSVYTACSIAEIVRAGILSVSSGQKEAAEALNLTKSQSMKMIVIPQAMCVIIPPLNSQFLNLAKNSSLAIAIGYVDIMATIGGVTLNQTGQALECIAIVMGTYLILSLLISSVMNYINNKVQIIER